MKRLENWVPALVVMAVIFVLSSTPGAIIKAAGFGKESYHIDGHFLLYFLLCFAYFKATNNIFYSIVLAVLYGITDELHQISTPGRSSSLFDVSTDAFGALLSGIILWKLNYLLPKKLKNWLNL